MATTRQCVVDFLESCLTPEGFQGALVGLCVEYVANWRDHGGVDGLAEAHALLDRLASHEVGMKSHFAATMAIEQAIEGAGYGDE